MSMYVWFFFFKQKTAYEMRISDWSSDVCSSDLIAKGGLDLDQLADEDEKKHQAEVAEPFKPLVERLTASLADKVKEVRVTGRLVDSPACVVVDENELSPHLLRMLQAAGQAAPEVKPILDRKSTRLNSSH